MKPYRSCRRSCTWVEGVCKTMDTKTLYACNMQHTGPSSDCDLLIEAWGKASHAQKMNMAAGPTCSTAMNPDDLYTSCRIYSSHSSPVLILFERRSRFVMLTLSRSKPVPRRVLAKRIWQGPNTSTVRTPRGSTGAQHQFTHQVQLPGRSSGVLPIRSHYKTCPPSWVPNTP